MSTTNDNSLETSFARSLAINKALPAHESGETVTARLPTELLSAIFYYVASVRQYFWSRLADEWTILPLVCKRWRDIAEPFLYRRIDLWETEKDKSTFKRQMAILLDNLERRPEVGSYIRMLEMRILTTEAEIWSALTCLVGRCRGLRWFKIHAEFGPHLSVLIRTIPTLQLETLHLAWSTTRPSLAVIFQVAHIATLRQLSLDTFDWYKNKRPHAIWPLEDTVDEERCVPPGGYASSGIESIQAFGAQLPLRVLGQLVSWPSRLKALVVHDVRYSASGQEYTVSAVERMLRTQRSSLTRIDIGILADDGMPDVSDFPSLDVLGLSAWNSLKQVPASMAQRKLAAPKLRELYINFDLENDTYPPYTTFDAPEVAWIQDLLWWWKSDPNHSQLERMSIDISPDFPIGEGKLEFWPWDRLEEAAVVARQFRVELDYSWPIWTREEIETGDCEFAE